MGLFNRNKQEKGAPPVAAAPASTPASTPATTTPAMTLPPSSPPRQQADTSVYSETTKSTKQTGSTSYHPEEDPIHEDEDEDFIDEEEAHKATTWDEGGSSHCGYSEPVHETLMKVGASVHKVVGEPPHFLETRMNTIANWFQEMSYAVRDFTRGESKMTDDIADVMNSVMQEDDEEHEDGDGLHHEDEEPHATTPAVTAN